MLHHNPYPKQPTRLHSRGGNIFVVLLTGVALGFLGQAAPAKSAPPPPVSPSLSSPVTIDLVRHGDLLLAPVAINASEPKLFVVDTGANHTVIDQDIAEELGLKEIMPVDSRAIGGTSQLSLTRIDRLEVGEAQCEATFVTTTDLSGLRAAEGDKQIHGILGMDFLGRMPFAIDFPNNRLVLHPTTDFTPPPSAWPTQAQKEEGTIRIKIDIQDTGYSGWFILDTGNNGALGLSHTASIINHPFLSNLPWKRSYVYGLGGVDQAREIRLDRISAFHQDWERVSAKFQINPQSTTHSTASGYFGARLLQKSVLTVDPIGGHVWCETLDHKKFDAALLKGLEQSPPDVTGVTPLMRMVDIASKEAVQHILPQSDLNQKDAYGATALLYAARRGDPAIVALLIDAGSDVNQTTRSGNSALMVAAEHGHTRAAQVLLDAKADVHQFNLFGANALILAAEAGTPSLVRSLIDAGSNINANSPALNTPLVASVLRENNRSVSDLLEAGANLTAQGKTPPALFVAVQEGNTQAVDLLIQHGADLHELAPDGRGLISVAAHGGHREIVKRLLQTGVSPDITDKRGLKAFDYAARKGHLEVMSLLYAPTPGPH